MFISQAMAQTVDAVSAGGTPDMWNFIIQFALIIFILYFLLIRPQQKKIKQHEAALNAIIKGTRVVIAGIEGVVKEVKEDGNTLRVEIAEGVVVSVQRGYVSHVILNESKSKK